MSLKIRTIQPTDNPIIADIVRQAMIEFDAAEKGTIFADPTLDTMFQNYQTDKAKYFVAEWDGEVVGGAGIKQLDGTEELICELQRMFLKPETRGKGIGKALMEKCLSFAEDVNYSACYIETLPKMSSAVGMYRKFGFKELDGAMGNTGHFGCNYWMLKQL
jgi:putative acetyltransferase